MNNYKNASKYVSVIFALISFFLGIYNIFFSDIYHIAIAFAGIFFLALPKLLYKLFKIPKLFKVEILFYTFCFLAYVLGIVCGLYKLTSFYDKFIHTLAGIFFSFIAVVILVFIKKEKFENPDKILISIFSFSFSMAVAAMWEVCEYIINIIFKTDPQNFQTTGLNDTMLDITVCLLGTVIFQAALFIFFKKDKTMCFINKIK